MPTGTGPPPQYPRGSPRRERSRDGGNLVGMTVRHHPCMASMEVDPELSDTLMHLSGYIFRAAINAATRKG